MGVLGARRLRCKFHPLVWASNWAVKAECWSLSVVMSLAATSFMTDAASGERFGAVYRMRRV